MNWKGFRFKAMTMKLGNGMVGYGNGHGYDNGMALSPEKEQLFVVVFTT